MANRVVKDLKSTAYNQKSEFQVENLDISTDDIDWCTGFWNEMACENTPSLYPDSPIFSSKEFDWDDPLLLENVFATSDIEDTFTGKYMHGHPAFMENQKNEGLYSVFSSSTSCEPDEILNIEPLSNATKQKNIKRARKAKIQNTQETSSKRQRTHITKKTKQKKNIK